MRVLRCTLVVGLAAIGSGAGAFSAGAAARLRPHLAARTPALGARPPLRVGPLGAVVRLRGGGLCGSADGGAGGDGGGERHSKVVVNVAPPKSSVGVVYSPPSPVTDTCTVTTEPIVWLSGAKTSERSHSRMLIPLNELITVAGTFSFAMLHQRLPPAMSSTKPRPRT